MEANIVKYGNVHLHPTPQLQRATLTLTCQKQVVRVPKLMQNASFICVVVGAFSYIFLQIFNSIHIFLQYSIQLSRNPYSP